MGRVGFLKYQGAHNIFFFNKMLSMPVSVNTQIFFLHLEMYEKWLCYFVFSYLFAGSVIVEGKVRLDNGYESSWQKRERKWIFQSRASKSVGLESQRLTTDRANPVQTE